jgi:hypothetical protein
MGGTPTYILPCPDLVMPVLHVAWALLSPLLRQGSCLVGVNHECQGVRGHVHGRERCTRT